VALDPIDIVINAVDQVSGVLNDLVSKVQAFQKKAGDAHEEGAKGARKHADSVLDIAKGFALAQTAIALFKEVGNRTFENLIGQNIVLRDQILSTAAQLTSKQDVLTGGKLIGDKVEAIKAAQGVVKDQIEQIRLDATKLSGVTSSDLVPSFQAMATNAGSLRLDLEKSRELTVRLTAQALVLGKDAKQAQAEIAQIATGIIDPTYNLLAKSIGLNNERLRQLASEGRLYDYIKQKTEAGLKGQELLAQSWKGVTSNIQEYIQLLTQSAGAPLLDALLKQFAKIEHFLDPKNVQGGFEAIKKFADEVGTSVGKLINEIGDLATDFAQAFTEGLGSDGIENVKEFIRSALDGFHDLAEAAKSATPLIQGVGAVFQMASEGIDELIVVARGAYNQLLKWIVDQLNGIANIKFPFYDKIPGLKQALDSLKESTANFDPFKNSAEAAESLRQRTEEVGKTSLDALNALNQQAARGKDLTQDQLKGNDKLIAQGKEQIKQVDEQIKALRAKAPIDLAEREQQKQDLKLLGDRKDLLQQALKGVKGFNEEAKKPTFQNQKLEERGTLLKQLEARAKAFTDTLNKPIDLNQATESAKKLIEVTKEQVEIGQITAKQAQERLKRIVSDNRLEVEVRQQAEKELESIRKQSLDRQKANIDAQLSAIEGKVAAGKLGEVAAAEQTTALKKKQLDIQLQDVEGAIAREQEAIKKGYSSTIRLQELKNQRDKLQSDLQKEAEAGQERIEQAKLKVIERAQKKALDAAKLAEIQRESDTQKLLNANLIRQAEADERNLQAKRATSEKELDLEKQKLAELEKLPAYTDPEKEAQRQQRIRDSRIKTSELTKQLLENERQLQEAHFRKIEDALNRFVTLAKATTDSLTQPLQGQLQLIDAQNNALDQQKKLLEARKGLSAAVTSYFESELSALTKAATTERERQSIAQITAAIKLRSLDQQQEIERRVLEINLQQEQAALRKEQIQNRMAKLQNQVDVLQAQADLAKTKAKPDATPEEIAAAQINLRNKQGQGLLLNLKDAQLAQQGALNEEYASVQRQTLALQQQGARDNAYADYLGSLPANIKGEAMRNFRDNLLGRLGIGNIFDLNQYASDLANGRANVNGFAPGINTNTALPGQDKINKLTDAIDKFFGQDALGNSQALLDKARAGIDRVSQDPTIRNRTKQYQDLVDKGALVGGILPTGGNIAQLQQQLNAIAPQTALSGVSSPVTRISGIGGGTLPTGAGGERDTVVALLGIQQMLVTITQAITGKDRSGVTIQNTFNGNKPPGEQVRAAEQQMLNTLYKVGIVARQQQQGAV
jgi:hypothetical protein